MDKLEKNKENNDESLMKVNLPNSIVIKIEKGLKIFAELSNLETVLIITNKGELFTGVSLDSNLTHKFLLKLIPSMIKSFKSIFSKLDNNGQPIESFHHGEDGMFIYTNEISDKFILFGMCKNQKVPVGVVRESFRQIKPNLLKIFNYIEKNINYSRINSKKSETISSKKEFSSVSELNNEDSSEDITADKGVIDDDKIKKKVLEVLDDESLEINILNNDEKDDNKKNTSFDTVFELG